MGAKAKESPKVDKLRQKLRKQMDEDNTRISEEALKDVSKEMYQWLQRHASERISLKDKNIVPFDSNKHPAQVQSKFVKNLLVQLQKNAGAKTKSKHSILRNRVSSQS